MLAHVGAAEESERRQAAAARGLVGSGMWAAWERQRRQQRYDTAYRERKMTEYNWYYAANRRVRSRGR